MSYMRTLVHGEQESFKTATLTPMQKMILRFVVVGLVYYGSRTCTWRCSSA